MAFTKINAAGIGSTESVTLDGLSVINNGSFGGNLTVGGVLTYEDVTNVDSVGLITARNGIVVGSGITLSKDGDIFFTGIATGNGSGLTNLATDLVNDTTPQLGGNLDVNTKNITFGDSGSASDDRLTFGAGTDLSIYHDGSNSYIQDAGTGDLIIQGSQTKIRNTSGHPQIVANDDVVELYYDNAKIFETTSVGVNITGQSTFVQHSADANLIIGSTGAQGAYLVLDGDSNGDAAGGDYAFLLHNSAGNLQIATDNPNSDSTIEFRTNGTHRSTVSATGMFEPALNNTYDLGTSSLRWRNIYTNDLNLSNEGSANSVDGTWGDYTIQEGESDLFLINKRSGKKYKFMLQEVS